MIVDPQWRRHTYRRWTVIDGAITSHVWAHSARDALWLARASEYARAYA